MSPDTLEQRRSALHCANEIRLARAVLRRRMGCGEISAAQLILHPPEAARSWDISALLRCQPRWGSARVRRLLYAQRISETKPAGALTERQRRVLADALATPRRPA